MATKQLSDGAAKATAAWLELAHRPRCDEIGGKLKDNFRAIEAFVKPLGQTPERFVESLMSAVRADQKLSACMPHTLIRGALQCAFMGLEPNTVQGLAYLVPFKRGQKIGDQWVDVPEAQLIIGYKGLVALMRRNGGVRSIHTQIVIKGDVFEVSLGTDHRIVHVPDFAAHARFNQALVPIDEQLTELTFAKMRSDEKKARRATLVAQRHAVIREHITHVYVVVKLADGETQFEIMSFDEIEAIRKRKGGQNGGADSPWDTDWTQMARKTVARRIANMLDTSPQAAFALRVQAANEVGETTAAIRTGIAGAGVIDGEFEEVEGDDEQKPAGKPDALYALRSKPADDDSDINDRDYGKGLPPPSEPAHFEPGETREPELVAKAPAKATPKPARNPHPSDLDNTDRPRGTDKGPHGDGLPF